MIEVKQSAILIKIWRKNFGAEILNIHGDEYVSGWPDCYIAHPRYNGFCEFKGAKTPIFHDQRIIIKNLVRNGTAAFYLRFLSDDYYEFMNHELTTVMLLDCSNEGWFDKAKQILHILGILQKGK